MRKLLLSLIFLVCTVCVYATGPSYVRAEIRPVSVNDKGEVLCRTRFIENGMGAHWYDRIEYGLCLLSEGKIIEFTTKILDNSKITPDSIPNREIGEITDQEYVSLMKHWDWVFKIGFDFENLSGQQKKICEKYGFKENNAEKYKVDKIYSLKDFEEERDIDLKKQKQNGLKNAKSTNTSYSNKVKVSYDFGKIILFQNEDNADESSIGFGFDYINPIFEYQNLEYEAYQITGVLFLN